MDYALTEADQQNISGSEITPFLLTHVNKLAGRELSAINVELINNNTALAA